MNGYGILYYPDGTSAYDGNWKDDKFNGILEFYKIKFIFF